MKHISFLLAATQLTLFYIVNYLERDATYEWARAILLDVTLLLSVAVITYYLFDKFLARLLRVRAKVPAQQELSA